MPFQPEKKIPFLLESRLKEELLKDSERHFCETLQDHWTMITVKDGEAVLWDNSTGNPEGPPAKLEAMVIGIAYCPYCGRGLGPTNPINMALTPDCEEFDS